MIDTNFRILVNDLRNLINNQIPYNKYNLQFKIFDQWTQDIASIYLILSHGQDEFSCFFEGPVIGIMRSSIEKFADIINLSIYGNQYNPYLTFLADNPSNPRNQNLEMHLKNTLHQNKITRKTRYYLLREFTNRIENYPESLRDFNNELPRLDSRFSSKLHNNPDPYYESDDFKINEIIHYISNMTLQVFAYLNLNSCNPNFIQRMLNNALSMQ